MRILILTCNTGGGHNAAASALRRELESRGHTCSVADALSFGPRHFSEAISHLHTIAYRYFPRIYGMIFPDTKGRGVCSRTKEIRGFV